MLRIEGTEVFYKTENLGPVENLKYTGEGFLISPSVGSTVFIPEEDYTPEQAKVFAAYHAFYADTGGVPPELPVEPGEPVPTPEERIAQLEQGKAVLEAKVTQAGADNLIEMEALAEVYEMILPLIL